MVTNISTIKNHGKLLKLINNVAANCLYLANQLTKTMAVTLIPYMPVKTQEILKILNIDTDFNWNDAAEFISAGHEIVEAKPIFSKVEDDIITKEKEELYENLKEVETMKDEISIEDFACHGSESWESYRCREC